MGIDAFDFNKRVGRYQRYIQTHRSVPTWKHRDKKGQKDKQQSTENIVPLPLCDTYNRFDTKLFWLDDLLSNND